MNYQLAASRSRWAEACRGLGGLVLIVGLVVGVPAALGAWVGWPLPRGVPSLADLGSALRDSYVPDAFVVKALALVCWLIWAQLVASLVVETVAYARGRAAAPLPLAKGMQRTAARLIAMVALLGALASARGVPDLPAPGGPFFPAGPAATQVVNPVEPAATAAPGPPLPVYEVQRYDSLWVIAEQHLGDPFRWSEIFEMNRGQPQGDGSTLQDPDRIYPGWVMQMPADATGLAAPAPVPVPASTELPTETGAPADETITLIDAGGTDGAGGGLAGNGDEEMMILLPDGSSTPYEPPNTADSPPSSDDHPGGEFAKPGSPRPRRPAPLRARSES